MNLKNSIKKNEEIIMPKICGMTVKEANEILEKYELKIREGNYTDEDIIKTQIPEDGMKVKKGKEIIIETN